MTELVKILQAHFNEMCASGALFRSSVTGDRIWDLYLNGFDSADDPVFRDPASSEHNCNTCKNFIRRYGNIVSVNADNKPISIFDTAVPKEYSKLADAIVAATKAAPIANVFFETFDELNSLPYEKCSKSNEVFRLGIDKNVKIYNEDEAAKYGVVTPGQVMTFHHIYLSLPKQYVNVSGDSVETIMAGYRSSKDVFKRGLDEISLDTLELVRDLINQDSLLNGKAHLHKIEAFIKMKKLYEDVLVENRDNWCWKNSYEFPYAKFRNELIGTLCTDITSGADLNDACRAWNKAVDPVNYMKTTAPITKRQIEMARTFVEENGYTESFSRRFATIDDIKVSEIKHIATAQAKAISIFDSIAPTSPAKQSAKFDNVETVSIDKFMSDILPNCTSVEAFLTNNHSGNMVTMTTSNVKESKPIFKWSNNYSWTFNGNLAGKSMIKETVKAFGGDVNGVLRFSIMWADGDGDNSDLDAHCIESAGTEIFFGKKHSIITGGILDIDIMMPNGKRAVENITYSNLSAMKDGTYKFYVRQYHARSSKGFKAEIAFAGELFSYEYPEPVSATIPVATVTLSNGVLSIVHQLPASTMSRDLYNLSTNEFHKVNLICLSPNHWGNNNAGNKHYFFMLDGCKCESAIRSFHSENLIPELAEHRKVLEILGASTTLQPEGEQLSGLGFNATVHDELIVRLKGSFNRVIKIQF